MLKHLCELTMLFNVIARLVIILSLFEGVVLPEEFSIETKMQKPTVLFVILARNKAHVLPQYLGYLEHLDYPKKRMALWIRSDHNVDNTTGILREWLSHTSYMYHSVNAMIVDSPPAAFEDEDGPLHWSDTRFRHVITLRQEALDGARNMWADYIFFVDCDNFLENDQTLSILLKQQKIIVAPMLDSLSRYSNFWCGMTEKGYYRRTEEYLPTLKRERTGCFAVPMVHSTMLVHLQPSVSISLTFDPQKVENYSQPEDDIIAFALSAQAAGIQMYIVNEDFYGHLMVPMEPNNILKDDMDQFTNLKLEVLWENPPMLVSPYITIPEIPQDKLGFDQVYMINLVRRYERRQRMVACFQELGIDVQVFDAIDGKLLNESILQQLNVKMLPIYADPYHKRALTMGEIGCFLSHYMIWLEIVRKEYKTAIVFEDDIRFEPYFRREVKALTNDLKNAHIKWDLIYLGRKRLKEEDEPLVAGTTRLVWVDYSYWTLCYMITFEGAKKLLAGDPLSKMVPVDEYLPIMFDKHPQESWKSFYPNRNLRAFSSFPLLVYPTHYTGEDNYLSDTEDSLIINGHDEL